jgi:hypothetical protein
MLKERSRYLERLAVDDETTIELILQKVKFVLGLFGSLDYMLSMVNTVYHITATRATQKNELTLGDLVNVLITSDQLGRDGDNRGRLNFVSSKHPDLNSRIP